MKPWLSQNDIKMFYKYLDKIQYYFEYGCGGSTYEASKRDNIKKIFSVDSDIQWQNKLKKIIKSDNINYIYNEMETKPNTWGSPGKNATNQQKINYSKWSGNYKINASRSYKCYFS